MVETAARMEQAVCIEVAPIKLVVNVTRHTHTRKAQHLAKSDISEVTRIISVHVAGQRWAKAKDAGVIEHNLMTGIQRDVTDPVEADAPDQGHGHDQVINW